MHPALVYGGGETFCLFSSERAGREKKKAEADIGTAGASPDAAEQQGGLL